MALKSSNGRQKHHTQTAAFTCYCELALKSAGMRAIHGGGGGTRAKEVILRGTAERLCMVRKW
jgi:hypothetical protein